MSSLENLLDINIDKIGEAFCVQKGLPIKRKFSDADLDSASRLLQNGHEEQGGLFEITAHFMGEKTITYSGHFPDGNAATEDALKKYPQVFVVDIVEKTGGREC